MVYTTRIAYEPLRSIAASSFTGSYQALGAPLAHPASIVKLINNSNVLVTISIDGSTAVDVAPANSFFLYDETSDSPVNGFPIFMPQGTQFYVEGASGLGNVYLVVQYVVQG